MTRLIEIRDLSKRFGGVLATNQVSLSVEVGEIRGLIRPNGPGKTNPPKPLTGIYPPDSGDIRLAGKNIAGLAPHDIARAGLMRSFQICRIFGNLTVRENLLVPYLARRRGTQADASSLVDEYLSLTTLDRLADQPAKRLSGGQRALLQVACGFMVPDLKCYVLDEPFAGINPVIKDAIIELILDDG